jgi:PadR family transcriptional regulator PadR
VTFGVACGALLTAGDTLCRLLHMKLSAPKVKVLRVFLEQPSTEQYGFGLMRATGVKSGSLYPILEGLERAGWIEGHEEDIDPVGAGRPRRHMYRLTEDGHHQAPKAVAEFYKEVGARPNWLPAFQEP